MQAYGIRDVKWGKITLVLTLIYTVLNLIASLYRADFLNITVCALAIYMLSSPFEVEPMDFRLLTFGTVLSLVYDFFWHQMQDYEAEEL